MTSQMEVLLLLPALLSVCFAAKLDCPRTDTDFHCHTDYNSTITCVWSAAGAGASASACTAHANKTRPYITASKFAHRRCTLLQPAGGGSEPPAPPLTCSMDLGKPNAFQSTETWAIELRCESTRPASIAFTPSCSVKMNPPEKPEVNGTTVSWLPQVGKPGNIQYVQSELQWKPQDGSWHDSPVRTAHCKEECKLELDPEKLVRGERYEARTRVLARENFLVSAWSDWSPTACWVSAAGRTRPPDAAADVRGVIAAGAVTFTVFMVVALLRTNTSTWVVKKIRGPPVPDPATSFLQRADFQNWLSPHFTGKSFHSFMKQEEILYVEVSCPMDAVAPCKPAAAQLETAKCDSGSGSGSSSFSNPSYSRLCSPPPISSLSAGNLQPCAADTPYGPVGGRGAADADDERAEDAEILRLFCRGGGGESVPVASDYEKVEKLQDERARLQSLDSRVCSGEEDSQESLETDSINVSDGHDEEPEEDEEEEEEEEKSGNDKEVDFRKLFGGSRGIFGKGSIQVCSGYERVQKLPGDSLELPSLDSGVGSGGEEQVSQEEDVDKATESTSFLFPPAFPLARPMGSIPHLHLKASAVGAGPDLPPVLQHMLDRNQHPDQWRPLVPVIRQ